MLVHSHTVLILSENLLLERARDRCGVCLAVLRAPHWGILSHPPRRAAGFGFAGALAGAATLGAVGLNALTADGSVSECYYDQEESQFGESFERRGRMRSRTPFGRYDIADAVDIAKPSLVHISKPVKHFGQVVGLGTGSGFVYSNDGYIVTNNHVIAGAPRVKVTMWDGRIFDGVVYANDKMSDLALVKIEPDEDLVQPRSALPRRCAPASGLSLSARL